MSLISAVSAELAGFFGSLEFVIDGVGGSSAFAFAFAFASASVFTSAVAFFFVRREERALG